MKISSQSKKPIIAIDLDNVLADTLGRWCKLVKERLGIKITKDQITDPRLRNLRIGARRSVLIRLLRETWVDWQNIPILDEEAPEIIERLRSRGFKVIIVTSRTKSDDLFISSWLKKNKIRVDDIIFLGYWRRKSEYPDLDMLIDDDAEEIRSIIKVGKVGIIYTQPWNQYEIIRGAYRIQKLRELENILIPTSRHS